MYSDIHKYIQCSKDFVTADTLKNDINKCNKNSRQKKKVFRLCNKEFANVCHLQRQFDIFNNMQRVL